MKETNTYGLIRRFNYSEEKFSVAKTLSFCNLRALWNNHTALNLVTNIDL